MNGGLAFGTIYIGWQKETITGKVTTKPISTMFTTLGAELLWFDWYGLLMQEVHLAQVQ